MAVKQKLYKITPTPKLYKTLQQRNTPGYNKDDFRGVSGIKPIKNTPENTSSNKVTTPGLMTVACAALLKRLQNKNLKSSAFQNLVTGKARNN